MRLTPKIEKAIRTATHLHDGQLRIAEEKLPYISHLFSVAAILSEYADDEDVIAAGLLHDTIEDTGYEGEVLEREFGERVRAIVEEVTETKMEGGGRLPWRVRKERYIEGLRRASAEGLMVSAADKLHNLRSLIEEREREGAAFFERFEVRAEEQLWFFKSVLLVLEERLENGIVPEYRKTVLEAEKLFLKKI